MYDSTRLTSEIAERFLEDDDSVDLAKFKTIEDAAAEILSKHRGPLNLDGLTSLSDAAAESFRGHNNILSLNGLKTLSCSAAKSLCRVESLFLDGLEEVSLDLARALIVTELEDRNI